MDIKSLKEPILNACNDIFPMFGLEHKFLCELAEQSLNSAENINILIGLTHGLKGNIVLGLSDDAAIKIISAMMGGSQVNEIDMMAKSALCEFMNILCGNMISKMTSDELIDISPPTLATGKNMYLLISKAPSKKIFFKFGETRFYIAYCLE